tara:strand:+ start:10288 stop:11013 length:726 start_codon:yes stop_codon:yes gene_type:complete
MTKIRLGVNIDHIATLRQVRGCTTDYPDLREAVKILAKQHVDQITIHLREDRRHIQEEDVKLLCEERLLPINLEMAASEEMEAMVLKYQPDWVCFVPEKREELTTEGGLDVAKQEGKLAKLVATFRRHNIRSSMFIEPSLSQVQSCKNIAADAVEFHTGKWVLLKNEEKMQEWKKLEEAALAANQLGLNVHAGHGLDYQTTKEITKLPHLKEVNIGHAIICYSVFEGLETVVKKMQAILSR